MSLREKKFDVEKSYDKFERYVTTYRDFNHDLFEIMTERTYILDMLYGIAISISQDYRMANGFDKFKSDLIKFLEEEK